MTNDKAAGWEYFWEYPVQQALFWIPLLAITLSVMGMMAHNNGYLGFALLLWVFFYLLDIPLVIWRVGSRTPSGDRWWAAAVLGYGFLPSPIVLFLQSAWGTALCVPLMVVAGVAAQIVALRQKPPRHGPGVHALILAGGGLAYALHALVLIVSALLNVVISNWDPPPGWTVNWPFVVIALVLSGAMFFVSVKVFAKAWRVYRPR